MKFIDSPINVKTPSFNLKINHRYCSKKIKEKQTKKRLISKIRRRRFNRIQALYLILKTKIL
tara:strand:+ start:266 stop:451 length:186 start_codon:yes stop_codon:yes gene_type:complete